MWSGVYSACVTIPDEPVSTPVEAPPDLAPYVASIAFWDEGASLALTAKGLAFGGSDEGARRLAAFVRSVAGWKGQRPEDDVAQEIKAHCVAWRLLPPLRGRANPIDLEFYMDWPQNLILSTTSVLRRCLWPRRASA